jgi:hypothetical protein
VAAMALAACGNDDGADVRDLGGSGSASGSASGTGTGTGAGSATGPATGTGTGAPASGTGTGTGLSLEETSGATTQDELILSAVADHKGCGGCSTATIGPTFAIARAARRCETSSGSRTAPRTSMPRTKASWTVTCGLGPTPASQGGPSAEATRR